MKKYEVNSHPKAKILFLIIVSVIGIMLFLQCLEFNKISSSLKILKINAVSSKERHYQTSTKLLTPRQLHEDIKIETKSGRPLEENKSYVIQLATANTVPVELTTTKTTINTTKRATITKINNTAVLSKIILFYTPFF